MIRTASALWFFSALGAAAAAGSPAFRFVVANDNYTGSVENGKSGAYLGADDFLTVSFLGEAESGPHAATLDYNVVTSRKLGFRYDLLTAAYARSFARGAFRHRAAMELLYRGDLGGKGIQNGFHDLKGLPPVHLPYDPPGAAAALAWSGVYSAGERLLRGLTPEAGGEARLPTGLVPVRLGANLSLRWRHSVWEAEALAGWRQYLTRPDHYGEMIRSGPLGGAVAGLHWPGALGLSLGAAFFPARNLENDPLFQSKRRSFSPQLWTAVCWNGSTGGLRTLLRYF